MLQIKLHPFDKFNFSKNILKIVILIIVCIPIITGCVINAPIDQSFITMKPCSAPCWYGLEPGKSKFEEIDGVLKRLPFIDPTTIRETSPSWLNDKDVKQITYKCFYQVNKDKCGSIDFYKGKLTTIYMDIAYSLTFGDAAKQLGTPDYVSYSITGAEDLTCIISIGWKGKSVSATSYHSGQWCPTENELKEDVKVRSDIKINTLYYTDKVWEDEIQCSECIPWPGFTDQ